MGLESKITRRQALGEAGWIAKSAIFSPLILASLQGCKSEGELPAELLVLDEKQFLLAKTLADTILPRTESPSASDVRVPEFLDLVLRDVMTEEIKMQFLKGLEQFDKACQQKSGNSFIDLEENQRVDYLTVIDKKVMEKKYEEEIPFYFAFKKLCVDIYFSTEQGIKENLNYNPIPGSFEGDITLPSDGRIEVGNEM